MGQKNLPTVITVPTRQKFRYLVLAAMCIIAACGDLAAREGSGTQGASVANAFQPGAAGGHPQQMIAIGNAHVCAVQADGTVLCWGANQWGQLGNGTTTDASTPVQVHTQSADGGQALLDDVVGITAGFYHSCAVRASGQVWCWGYNAFGNLGNGSTDVSCNLQGQSCSSLAVQAGAGALDAGAALLNDVISVAAGYETTCAVHASGVVSCWGANTYGALGTGSSDTNAYQSTPQPVINASANPITGMTGIAGSGFHFCASSPMLVEGARPVLCWGNNDNGELGTGVAESADGANAFSDVAVSASALSQPVVSLAAGIDHTCALTPDGSVLCWGDNAYGSLGNGNTTSPEPTPQSVLGLSNIVQIAANYQTTCALDGNGSVYCWGLNDDGQAGAPIESADGQSNEIIVQPIEVAPQPAVWLGSTPTASAYACGSAVGLAVGIGNACIARADGSVSCWGSNSNGQLGGSDAAVPSDALSAQATPIPVLGATSAGTPPSISTGGGSHTCALHGDGTGRCWGLNSYGQIGDGTAATPDGGPPGVPYRLSPVQVVGLRNASQISTGQYHTCAVSDGTVLCWGDNSAGQLGDGTTAPYRSVPTIVAAPADGGLSLSQVVQVTTGYLHTCALTSGGQVYCWGDNSQNQLGNGMDAGVLPNSNVPTLVGGSSPLANVISISAFGYFTCAVLPDSDSVDVATCWGQNNFGQLGNGSTTPTVTPTQVQNIGNVDSISAGAYHACAVTLSTAGRSLSCWGDNGSGQLGTGSDGGSYAPVPVSNIGGDAGAVLAVSAGGLHTCALLPGGTADCWGDNSDGELGTGGSSPSSVPTAVSNLTNATAITAGYMRTCALLADGTADCWGYNGDGPLGTGNMTEYNSPTQVPSFSRAQVCASDYARCNGGADCCSGQCVVGVCLTNEENTEGGAPPLFAGYGGAALAKRPANTWNGQPDSGVIDQLLVFSNSGSETIPLDAGLGPYDFWWAQGSYGVAPVNAVQPNMVQAGYMCSNRDCSSGTPSEAGTWLLQNHPDWIEFQCNPNGTPPTSIATATPANPEGQGLPMLDVANSSVQAWQQAIISGNWSQGYPAMGADNVFIQSVFGACGHFANCTPSADGGYPSCSNFVKQYSPNNIYDPPYAVNQVRWLAQMRSQMPVSDGGARMMWVPNGKYLEMDPYLSPPWPGVTFNPVWLEQMFANVDGFLDEGGFTRGGSPGAGSNGEGIYLSETDWLQRIHLMEDAQRFGVAYFLVNEVSGDAGAAGTRAVSTSDLQFALASYLMAREQSAYFYVGNGQADYGYVIPYPELSVQLGHPCGALTRPSLGPDIYVRKFSNGLVAVYPAAGGEPENVALPTGTFEQVECTGAGPPYPTCNSWPTVVPDGGEITLSPQQGAVLVLAPDGGAPLCP